MSIQIMKTYKESFQNVRTHKQEWLRVASGPLLIWVLGALFFVFTVIASGYYDERAWLTGTLPDAPPLVTTGYGVYNIVYFIAMISLYINGYRYAVLQEGGNKLFNLNLNMRFVKMFLYTILIMLSALILWVVLFLAAVFIGAGLTGGLIIPVLVVILFGIYLLLRISLYPLLIAVDQRKPIRTSWRLMKGNILRFIGLFLLVGLTLLLIGSLGGLLLIVLSSLFAMINPVLPYIVIILGLLFGVFMVLFFWAVFSKMMGIIYQDLSA